MAVGFNSAEVSAGDTALASQYNNSRKDALRKVTFEAGENVSAGDLCRVVDVSGEKAKLITAANTTPTFGGSSLSFTSNSLNSLNICKIDTNKVAVVFSDNGDTDKGKCIIGTISTDTITWGSIVTFTANITREPCITEIDTDKIFIAWRDQTASSVGKGIVATVSGTVPTFGTEVTFDAGTISAPHCTDIDTDKVAIKYTLSSSVEIIIATISA